MWNLVQPPVQYDRRMERYRIVQTGPTDIYFLQHMSTCRRLRTMFPDLCPNFVSDDGLCQTGPVRRTIVSTRTVVSIGCLPVTPCRRDGTADPNRFTGSVWNKVREATSQGSDRWPSTSDWLNTRRIAPTAMDHVIGIEQLI